MKALVLRSVGNIEYTEVPAPAVKSGEVLLKIKACGICSSDIPRIFTTGTYHFPTIPGHEFSGQIVDVGEGIERSLIGRRAVVFPLLPCRKCASCKAEEYARCENYNYFGSRCDGAFAEYLAVPVWNIITFSDDIPYTTAALCEPASVAKHCADAGQIRNGDIVAVIGTGTIGFLAALWAKELGAGKVIVVGRNDEKLEFAKKLGIDNIINSQKENSLSDFMNLTDKQGADVVLECVGSNQSIGNSVLYAKKGGKIVLTGNPEGDICLDKQVYWKILRNELSITGTWNSSYSSGKNDWKSTIAALENGNFNISELITHTFSLAEYEKAFETVKSKEEFSIKVMFEI